MTGGRDSGKPGDEMVIYAGGDEEGMIVWVQERSSCSSDIVPMNNQYLSIKPLRFRRGGKFGRRLGHDEYEYRYRYNENIIGGYEYGWDGGKVDELKTRGWQREVFICTYE